MGFTWVDLIGYLASALVVASLAMRSVVRLRIVSLVGSVVFVGYGVALGSIPVIITNTAVAVINVWFLRKEFSSHRDLGAVPIAADAPFLQDFLRSHAGDIAHFHPGFRGPGPDDLVLLLTRNGLPAGAFIGTRDGDTLRLQLDYVMSAYRDSRIGTWLYRRGTKAFTEAGATRIVAERPAAELRSYLLRVGFTAQGDDVALALS
jgi:hypothetical protein